MEKKIDIDYEAENIKDEDLDEKKTSEEESDEILNEDLEIEEPEVVEEGEDEPKEEADSYKLSELNERFLRLSADFSNYKRRTENEKKSYIEMGVKKLALAILPTLDDFDRALLTIEDEELKKGIVMIRDGLLEALKNNEIVPMDCKGKKFDPNLHDAVMVEESEDYDADTVIEVFQNGYLIDGKTLRPAMVKVSK